MLNKTKPVQPKKKNAEGHSDILNFVKVFDFASNFELYSCVTIFKTRLFYCNILEV